MAVKILLLAADIANTPSIQTTEESRTIQEIARNIPRPSWDTFLPAGLQISDLASILMKEKPDIVHFCGHGVSSSELLFPGRDGTAQAVSQDVLKESFALYAPHVRCVVLNACYSEIQAQAIAEVVDCVIGISGEIEDGAAVSFAKGFYTGLARGADIVRAFKEGRHQISIDGFTGRELPRLVTFRANPSRIWFAQPDPILDQNLDSDKRADEKRQRNILDPLFEGIVERGTPETLDILADWIIESESERSIQFDFDILLKVLEENVLLWTKMALSTDNPDLVTILRSGIPAAVSISLFLSGETQHAQSFLHQVQDSIYTSLGRPKFVAAINQIVQFSQSELQ